MFMHKCVVECVSCDLVNSLHSQQVLQWMPLPRTLAHLPLATLLLKLATPHPKLDTLHSKLDILLLLPGTHHLQLGSHP